MKFYRGIAPLFWKPLPQNWEEIATFLDKEIIGMSSNYNHIRDEQTRTLLAAMVVEAKFKAGKYLNCPAPIYKED